MKNTNEEYSFRKIARIKALNENPSRGRIKHLEKVYTAYISQERYKTLDTFLRHGAIYHSALVRSVWPCKSMKMMALLEHHGIVGANKDIVNVLHSMFIHAVSIPMIQYILQKYGAQMVDFDTYEYRSPSLQYILMNIACDSQRCCVDILRAIHMHVPMKPIHDLKITGVTDNHWLSRLFTTYLRGFFKGPFYTLSYDTAEYRTTRYTIASADCIRFLVEIMGFSAYELNECIRKYIVNALLMYPSDARLEYRKAQYVFDLHRNHNTKANVKDIYALEDWLVRLGADPDVLLCPKRAKRVLEESEALFRTIQNLGLPFEICREACEFSVLIRR